MDSPTLYIFSGLPASGKSTLAQELAKKIRATFVRIDTIEQGLRDICKLDAQGDEGYNLSYLVAGDNLKLGNSVVADSVNPLEITRKAWTDAAFSTGASFVNIEVICSDLVEHKIRVESRQNEVRNLKLPTWEEVQSRDYESWTEERIVIDTAGKTPSESAVELFEKLKFTLT